MTKVARTPSSFRPVAGPDALDELEFGRALDLVAAHAVGPLGADAVRARRPGSDLHVAREALAAVAELARVLAGDAGFAPEPVPDLSPILETLLVQGGVLDGDGLLALGRALKAIRAVRQGLVALEAEAPRAAALAVDVPPGELGRAIERAIDDDGSVKDEASPEVRRARRSVLEARAKLIGLLERKLRELAGQGFAGDAEVTVRDGRYVIPVRREARGRVSGLIHGESASGATVFFEPPEAVDVGNELSGAEAREARAVQAVLRELTEQARAYRDEIEAGWRMAIAADDLYARARYQIACGASLPALNAPPGALAIRRGVHPLLRADAVPFDLDLSSARTLVVSGPNAGGKTVLLKSVGVVCALAQSGVVPPVADGTELPVFSRIFVDIGDHQSIAESLSTFSAHLAALERILTEADRESLVLLDELGGGTDPAEGAALAGAVLLSLHERGSVTLATTHLSGLKELAAEREGVVNASLEFDAETLAPTYRFKQGKPGRSYGLAIAKRLGLPPDVIAAAEALIPEEMRTLEATLEDLERREQALAGREAAAIELSARLAALQRSLDVREDETQAREARAREREIELEKAGREQARKFLLEARKRVEEALGVARAAVSEATAKEARRLVEEGVSDEAEALKQLERLAREKGWVVRGSKEQGAVPSVGSQTSGASAGATEAETPPEKTAPRSLLPAVEAASEVDVRGLRADEAETAVVSALDAAVVADLPQLRIIHGKGTGALREVVKRLLAGDHRVQDFHLAPPHQGGGGVTVVELAR